MSKNSQKTPALQVVDTQNATPETDWINIEMPLSIKLWGKRSDENKRKIAVDILREHSATMIEHIGFVTEAYHSGWITQDGMLSINATLSAIGKAVIDAIEIVENTYERAKPENSEKQAA